MSTLHLITAIAWLIALIISAGVWRTRDAPRAGLAALALAAQLPGALWGATLPRETPAATPDVAHATPRVAPTPHHTDHTTPEDRHDPTPTPPPPDGDTAADVLWLERRARSRAR